MFVSAATASSCVASHARPDVARRTSLTSGSANIFTGKFFGAAEVANSWIVPFTHASVWVTIRTRHAGLAPASMRCVKFSMRAFALSTHRRLSPFRSINDKEILGPYRGVEHEV